MKAALFLCLIAASQLSADYVFLPGTSEVRSFNLEIPGVLIDNKDALTLLPEGEFDEAIVPKADVQARGKLGFKAAAATLAAATSTKAVAPLASILSAAASTPPIVAFQADTSLNAAAPLCLACTCKLGRTSCKDAGGVAYWSSGEPAIGQGSSAKCGGNGCVIEAPATLSACDPVCKKRTATCNPQVSPATNLRCTENIDTSVCNTDCQFRAAGEKVVCNQQAIARGVINDVPKDVCSVLGNGRKRRDAGKDKRQARFLGNSFLARLIPAPASTIRIPGAARLSYAPTGRCIPQEIANAPYCTTLD